MTKNIVEIVLKKELDDNKRDTQKIIMIEIIDKNTIKIRQ